MKLKILLFAGSMLIMIACNLKDKAISGVYITAFKNEYSIANDTLIVNAFNLSFGTYKIERRSGFHRIRDGKVLPKEFKRETWMVTFNKNKRALQETEYGRQIYIDIDGRLSAFGSIYQKIQ